MGVLAGKTALVTGGARGIGRAIAVKLASEGANVVINYLDAEPVESVIAEITQTGAEAESVPGSVTESGFAERFVHAAVARFGGIDIIINNVGYTWDNVIQ